jgi:prepilin-type N-terminal cleavage/methylation domain-containing protein
MTLSHSYKRSKAFTLVEILLVVIIIGILGGALMLVLGSSTDRAEATRIVQDLKTLSKASLSAFADTGRWPEDTMDLEDYLDRDLCQEGRVCYGVYVEGSNLLIRAVLGNDVPLMVRDKLSSMAVQTGLLQLENDALQTYVDGDSVYLLVHKALADKEGTSIFNISFDDPSEMDLFTKVRGAHDWIISHGTLQTTTDHDEARYLFGDPTWQDYTVDLSVVLTQGNGYGVYYRANGENDVTGYVFQYDPGLGNDFVVREVNNGRESSPIQRVDMKDIMGDDFNVYDTSHEISISVEGDHHVISVDGVEVFNFVDDTFSEGSAGLRKWHNTHAVFEEISIEEKQ